MVLIIKICLEFEIWELEFRKSKKVRDYREG